MKIKIFNYSARYNDIFIIPTISIARANITRYFDVDFSFLWFMISVRFTKELLTDEKPKKIFKTSADYYGIK